MESTAWNKAKKACGVAALVGATSVASSFGAVEFLATTDNNAPCEDMSMTMCAHYESHRQPKRSSRNKKTHRRDRHPGRLDVKAPRRHPKHPKTKKPKKQLKVDDKEEVPLIPIEPKKDTTTVSDGTIFAKNPAADTTVSGNSFGTGLTSVSSGCGLGMGLGMGMGMGMPGMGMGMPGMLPGMGGMLGIGGMGGMGGIGGIGGMLGIGGMGGIGGQCIGTRRPAVPTVTATRTVDDIRNALAAWAQAEAAVPNSTWYREHAKETGQLIVQLVGNNRWEVNAQDMGTLGLSDQQPLFPLRDLLTPGSDIFTAIYGNQLAPDTTLETAVRDHLTALGANPDLLGAGVDRTAVQSAIRDHSNQIVALARHPGVVAYAKTYAAPGPQIANMFVLHAANLP